MRTVILILSALMLATSAFSNEHRCWVSGELQGKEFEVPDLEVDESKPDQYLAEQTFGNYKFMLQYTPANSRFPYPAKLFLTISKEESNRSIPLLSTVWLDGYAKFYLPNQEGYVEFKCFLNEH